MKSMPCGGFDGRRNEKALTAMDYVALRLIGEHEKKAAEMRRRYR